MWYEFLLFSIKFVYFSIGIIYGIIWKKLLSKGKLKVKIHDNTTIEEIEALIDEMKKSNAVDFDFADLIKIAEGLGATYLGSGAARGKGSQERFNAEELKGLADFPIGNFGVHVFPSGKHQFKVYKRNFVDYFYPALKLIILIKRAKQNEK